MDVENIVSFDDTIIREICERFQVFFWVFIPKSYASYFLQVYPDQVIESLSSDQFGTNQLSTAYKLLLETNARSAIETKDSVRNDLAASLPLGTNTSYPQAHVSRAITPCRSLHDF